MRRNTQHRVMVVCGYYNLITPFFDAEYTFSRNGFSNERIELKYFTSGHIIYNHHPDFEKWANDIKAFIGELIETQPKNSKIVCVIKSICS